MPKERNIRLPSWMSLAMFVSGFILGMFFSSTIFELVKTFTGSGIASMQGTFTSAKDFATTNTAGVVLGLAIALGIVFFIKKILMVVIGFIFGFFIMLFLQTQGIAIPTLDSLIRSIIPV